MQPYLGIDAICNSSGHSRISLKHQEMRKQAHFMLQVAVELNYSLCSTDLTDCRQSREYSPSSAVNGVAG